ncbi:sigma-70 family RNA polymerase sigma factor [Allobranchiibius huperziae]|uniref:RNA polymerase sigma-B factor n=1 Tax=Allobranchiibius huperziae TaxID=1874116 RepID=A0A853DKF3_9MICO|nr:RNA polymerase sigma-B factor [Allobranchiibius huperziae]
MIHDSKLGGAGQTASADRDARTATLLERARLSLDSASAELLRADAIELNIALATSIARRYTNRGVELDDLRQVGLVALVLAIDRFDPQHGTRFTPFASITIHGELKRYLRDHAWAVRPPRRLHDRYNEINGIVHELTQKLGRSPSTEQIAQSMGLTTAQVQEARHIASSYTATSLNALVVDQGDNVAGDGLNLGTVPSIEARLTALQLGQAIATLPPRDRLIVQLRFDQDLTQREIGERLGISQMQVSRLISSLMNHLRDVLGGVGPASCPS